MQGVATARIIWGAMLMSVFVFYGLTFVLTPDVPAPPDPLMPYMFAMVVMGEAVASFLLPAHIRRQALANVNLVTREVDDPNGMPGVAKIRVPVNLEAARSRAIALFTTPFILSIALAESIALFGFVLFFLDFDRAIFSPFYAVSLVLIALRFPTERDVFDPFEAATGVRLVDG